MDTRDEMATRIAIIGYQINSLKKEANRLLVGLGETEKYFIKEAIEDGETK